MSVIDGPRHRRRPTAGAPQRVNRSRAAQRAVNRRAARLAREEKQSVRPKGGRRGAPRPGLVEQIRGLPFAVPVIGLVALGLVATLWLSTRAAQDSYELTVAKTQNQALVDKRDALKRTYESADSAPELSDKAARLGLVPTRNAARLVVGENGRVSVRGTPAPAKGRAPASINPKPADDALRHIDTNKVEDSTGLPGSGSTQQQDQTQPQDQTQQQEQGQPEDQSQPEDQGQPQQQGQTQTPDQTPPAPAPAPEAAPNVLPAPPATRAPGANPRRNS
nr:hypothetical protein [Gordonia araii]